MPCTRLTTCFFSHRATLNICRCGKSAHDKQGESFVVIRTGIARMSSCEAGFKYLRIFDTIFMKFNWKSIFKDKKYKKSLFK